MDRRGESGRGASWLLVPLLAMVGCGEVGSPAPKNAPEYVDETGTVFDAATAGTIQGQVIWNGQVPEVPPLEVLPNPLAGEVLRKKQLRPNPNALLVDAQTKGVANAVVFLRGLDGKRGRPWHHPPVSVEQRAGQFHVMQGTVDSRCGFVRRGDGIEMVSRDRFFHSLHAAGAAFFTLTFPDPDLPLRRSLKENGLVELTSGTGYFWMRGYLFVDDHPYYARSDAEGQFVLPLVPAGRYELVCWMPNWLKARHERDPESGFVTRLFFQPPLCVRQTLTIAPNETKQTTFALSLGLFSGGS